ncbi:MAG: MarR family transcriptional regulator [Flavobacteriales bacterium]|nr:MarR family transcriptional regulator [Flavobacteriales bacterium]
MPGIEEEVKGKFDSEQHKAVVNVMFTAGWLKSGHTADMAPYGLSPQQFNILRILRGAKGTLMSMQDVKCRMIDRSPNATRLADKLLAKGLMERERCEEDRRVVYVRITPKGLDLLKRMDQEVWGHFKEEYERLSANEARTLNRLLDKLRG